MGELAVIEVLPQLVVGQGCFDNLEVIGVEIVVPHKYLLQTEGDVLEVEAHLTGCLC